MGTFLCIRVISFSKNVFLVFFPLVYLPWARDSSVGIATRYRLHGHCIESRWGWDFPHLSRPTALGPTQPPVQCVPGLFPGHKAAGAWRWPSTPLYPEVKERVKLYLYSPSGPSWKVIGWTILSYLFLCLFLHNFIYVSLCHSTSWLSSCVFYCPSFLLWFVAVGVFYVISALLSLLSFFPLCVCFYIFFFVTLFLSDIFFPFVLLLMAFSLCPFFCHSFCYALCLLVSVLSYLGPTFLCTGWSSPGPSGGSGVVLPWSSLPVLSLCMCVPPRAIRAGSARATRHSTVTHTHCLIACNKPCALSSPSVIYNV